MNTPLISLVIPTYNRATFIAKTVHSLLSQTYQNFEIIIVDDGSTDNTEEIVNSISDSRLSFYKKKNEERAAARNYGTKIAKGEYVNFFDSDDLAYQSHLETAVSFIGKNNFPEVFHLGYDIKDIDGNILRTPQNIHNINKQIARGNLLSCNGVFIRKDIALANPFNQDRALSASEDYVLWIRLAAQFQFKHSVAITSTVIDHDARSVLTINPKQLIERKNLMLEYIFNDDFSKKVYHREKNRMESDAYSYIALHLALSNNNFWLTIKFIVKALLTNPKSLFSRRMLATIKHLLL